MKAIVIREPGKGVEAWTLVDRPKPEPGPGQVLLRVRAASLNYRDLLATRNQYGSPQPNVIALADGAGEIAALGAGVTRWKVGDRVIAAYYPAWHAGPITPAHDRTTLGIYANDGVLAEYALLAADGVVRTPSYLSDDEAATLPCAALTAWHALLETRAQAKPGATLVVQGTGGVSLFATQFARAAGLRVIATSSSAAKLARLKDEHGVSDGIDYRATPAWSARVRELTNGEGADHVLDVGGAGTLAESFQATRYGGAVSVLGMLTGFGAAIDPLPILTRALRVDGVRVGTTTMLERMNRALEALRLKPVVDEVFPFDRARAALAKLEAGTHFGKLVIRVG